MLFDAHISEINKNIVSNFIVIRRINDNFDKLTTIIVVQSIVLSLMNCCINIWGSTNVTLLHRVQKLQNFASKNSVRELASMIMFHQS